MMSWHSFVLTTDFGVRSLTATVMTAGVTCIYFFLPVYFFSYFIAGAIAYLFVCEWIPHVMYPAYHFYGTERGFWPLFFSFMTPFYPALPCYFLFHLSWAYPFFFPILFLVITAHDTAAYMIGKKIGRHKCAPSISPHKSWEGAIAGFCVTMLCVKILYFFYRVEQSWLFIIFISFVISVMCVGGDLFESWIKRKIGIKDFGTLLPGHGGVLDRCDALLFMGTLTFIFRKWLISVLGAFL